MNTQSTETKVSIAEYLATVAASHVIDGHVVPKEVVGHQIEAEIGRRCGCTPAVLATDQAMGRTHELNSTFLSAKPDAFVREVLAEIQRISDALSEQRAQQFEITFENKDVEPNLWRDRIFVGVRFLK